MERCSKCNTELTDTVIGSPTCVDCWIPPAEARELREAAKAVILWAETPGDHGGNPYCKDFVQKAIKALGQ